MLERGYRRSFLADIAANAGVHIDTVCELVGRKPHAPGRPSVPRPRYIDVWESEADWDRWARLP